ncbi:MAG: HAD-IA family hydrolase [Lentisphaerae bacterium]|nr:HAD-IA family hydrolase [Lentisphaerota bacterium]
MPNKRHQVKRQVLIFDLDGTLIDSRRDLAAGINRMRAHYALAPLSVGTIAGFIGQGVHDLVTRALQDAAIAQDIDEAARLYTAFYREHICDETTLYPGVREGLARLARAGHALALLSNKPGDDCQTILRHFQIETLFNPIIGADSGLALKPDPQAVVAILQAVSGLSADTWMIGDNHTDIAAARRAGTHSIFVTYGFGTLGIEKPEVTVASFEALTRMFLN